jgi:dynein heavy chain
MLVGPPMGSKSSIISSLLNESPIVINPKAVSLAELYGNFDPVTQTWTDGLAAKILRQSAVSHEYVLFDGPVDSLWIENLNTVLDDSMMLCLSNGERIKLSSRMRVLFEVNDLNQASPATVSRCGMVWVSEEIVPWEDLISSYFMRNPVLENEVQMQYLINTIKNSFKKGYNYIKKFCREMIKLNESTIVHSYCKFVKNHIDLIP